ncbi:MAG: hypothetical protein SVY53_14475 [Chloroflexota bacterium]|nr:hypothetical protein [Chloroflexota bacterium]
MTIRQRAFLTKLIDLYGTIHEPVHYSAVADQLGVSASTDYDMLKLLEKKGMITSAYITPKKASGPGRSSVLFLPTERARDVFSNLADGYDEDHEWEKVKYRVLDNLRKGKASDDTGFIQDLIAMIPKTRSPLAACAQIITMILLSLREARHNFGPLSPLSILIDKSGSKLGMSTLVGVATGLMFDNQIGRGLSLVLKE